MTDGIDLADRVQSGTGGLQLSSAARQQHAQAMEMALNRVQEPSDGGNRSKTAMRVTAFACAALLAGGYGLIAATQPQPDSLRLTGPPVTAPTSLATLTTAGTAASEPSSSVSAVASPVSSATTSPPPTTTKFNLFESIAPSLRTPAPEIAPATSARNATASPSPTTQPAAPATALPPTTERPNSQPATSQPAATQPVATLPPEIVVPPQVVPMDLYLLNSAGGTTASSRLLPLGLRPATSPLTNFDTDRDDEDGILIQKDGAGLSGNDPVKYQEWVWTSDEPTMLEGDITLTVWAASKDFKTDEQIGIAARLEVCSPNCSTIGIGSWSRPGQSDFQLAEIRLTSIDTLVPAGATIVIRIATPDDLATNDSWIAFGATNYPAKLSVG